MLSKQRGVAYYTSFRDKPTAVNKVTDDSKLTQSLK